MIPIGRAVATGHYARKQLLCRNRIISWVHDRRFAAGLRLARRFSGKRVLDYGCGDGTFLALLASSDAAPREAIGAEISAPLVSDCRERLAASGRPLDFVLVDELDRPRHRGAFDGIVCMEVLEHVIDCDPVLARFDRLLSQDGVLLISVPVETGLPLLVKQAARRIAGWRGIGDYPGNSPYSFREYVRSVAAGARQHIERPILAADTGRPFHDHKGFNWMMLRDRVARFFRIEQVTGSPFAWLPPRLASQVWFVARKQSAAGSRQSAVGSRQSAVEVGSEVVDGRQPNRANE